ncbi:anti-sigma factor domain-containing protein [Evansella sp. AB-rgal1]|uniref:anti-sigma factor domain-containing protein n=1 Tax=Evansella sp. AB-rgal1 TaxID=3242696 RepID=UPI00359E5F8F
MIEGVVVELEKRYMVVLTRDGEFHKTRREDGVMLGEEVRLTPSRRMNYVFFPKKFTLLAVAVVMFCFIPMYVFITSTEKVYGLVAVDINPSVKFTINSKYEVMDVTPYNEKGVVILNKIETNIIGLSLQEAIYQLLLEGSNLGFVKENQSIYISSSLNLKSSSIFENNYDRWIDGIQENIPVDVITLNLEDEVVTQAHKNSLSPVKYLLLKDAENRGVSVNFSSVSNTSIQDIEENSGRELKSIISSSKMKVNIKEKNSNPVAEKIIEMNIGQKEEKMEPKSKSIPIKGNNGLNEENQSKDNKRDINKMKEDEVHPSELRKENSMIHSPRLSELEKHPSELKGNNRDRNNNGRENRNNSSNENSRGKGK